MGLISSLRHARTRKGQADRFLDTKMLLTGVSWADRVLNHGPAVFLPRVKELEAVQSHTAVGNGLELGLEMIRLTDKAKQEMFFFAVDSEAVWKAEVGRKRPLSPSHLVTVKPHQLLQLEAPRDLEQSSVVGDSLYESAHLANKSLISGFIIFLVVSRLRGDDRRSAQLVKDMLGTYRERGGKINVVAIVTAQHELALSRKLRKYGVEPSEVQTFSTVDIDDPVIPLPGVFPDFNPGSLNRRFVGLPVAVGVAKAKPIATGLL